MAPARAEPGDQETCRKIFDDLSLRVITFLESHPAACGVKFQDRPGVTQAQLQKWEKENHPHFLPEDYKAFLAISNGVTIRWDLRFSGESVPFGTMHVNQLEQVKPLPEPKLDKFFTSNESRLAKAFIRANTSGRQAAAFDLDAECNHGRVALVYWEEDDRPELMIASIIGAEASMQRPQVWFQDLSCQWHFIADSFADYFRLVATHLGIPQWQYAFTDAGLGAAASHWLAFFCPERLAVAAEQNPSLRACTSRTRHCSNSKMALARPESPHRRRRRRDRSSSKQRHSRGISSSNLHTSASGAGL